MKVQENVSQLFSAVTKYLRKKNLEVFILAYGFSFVPWLAGSEACTSLQKDVVEEGGPSHGARQAERATAGEERAKTKLWPQDHSSNPPPSTKPHIPKCNQIMISAISTMDQSSNDIRVLVIQSVSQFHF